MAASDTPRPPRLRVRDVHVAFDGFKALGGVSVDVPAGQVVGLIGPNGAGKTTLLDVVCGRTTPASGTVELDGEPFAPDPYRLAALGIARTLQGLRPPDGSTVLDHVLAGAADAPRTGLGWIKHKLFAQGGDPDFLKDRAQSLLREAELADLADISPTELGTEERRRLALARALIGQPRLLLLDEPAGGIAGEELAKLARIIRATPRRGADRPGVLLVEHHVDLVMEVCDHVVVLDHGRVIASGTPAEIRTSDAARAAYLDAGRADAGGADGAANRGPA